MAKKDTLKPFDQCLRTDWKSACPADVPHILADISARNNNVELLVGWREDTCWFAISKADGKVLFAEIG